MMKFYQIHGVTTDDISLYRPCYENLQYHSNANKDTSIFCSVHKTASCPNTLNIF